MLGGVLVVANAGVCRDVFRPTGGVSGIHMSGDDFQLGGGTGVKLGRMIGGIWSYHCI